MGGVTLGDILELIEAYDELKACWPYVVRVRVQAEPEEVEAWVIENLRGRLTGKAGTYGFEDETDATAFKTRFG